MVSFGGLGTLEDMAGDTLLYNLDANGVSEGSNESSGKTYRTKLTPETTFDSHATETSSVLQRHDSTEVDVLPDIDWVQWQQPSGCQKRRRQQEPRNATEDRRKRVKRLAAQCVPGNTLQSPKSPKAARKAATQLFPCPFYTHDPERFGHCIRQGWTINRLKEHLYRRHCPEHVCDRCSQSFESVSQLSRHHLSDPNCRVRIVPTCDHIDSRKKAMIRKGRMNGKPCAEKWDWIYRLIFECAPPSTACESKGSHKPVVEAQTHFDNYSGVRSAEDPKYSPTALPVERRLSLDEFEDYVANEMRFSYDPDLLFEYQACLNTIKRFRGLRCQSRSSELSELSSAASSGDSSLLGGTPPRFEDPSQNMYGGLGAWQPEMVSSWLPNVTGQLGIFGGTNWPYHLPEALSGAGFEADVPKQEAQEAQLLWGWQNGVGPGGDGSFFF